jgi:hypothetical protein
MAEMYYRHSHLPGAINLPADQVGERAPDLLPDKDAEIVVYCIDLRERPLREPPVSWRRWDTRGAGLCGGKKDWIEAGLPAEGRYYERRRERDR